MTLQGDLRVISRDRIIEIRYYYYYSRIKNLNKSHKVS